MTNPIYIIGNNALACYLGAQLQSGGNDVIMLLDRKNAAEAMATDGISIKEDRSLTQKRHKLNAATFMKEPAKMVIIADYANKINGALSNVSAIKTGNAPVVCFTPLKDMSYLAPIVGKNLHPAYFNGYVMTSKNTVSLLGRNTNITLCPPENGEIDPIALNTFTESRMQISANSNRLLSFWEFFAPYALCSLLSAAENQKISDILKDKANKEAMRPLVDEFCCLAQTDDVVLRADAVLKTIYSTPANYIYPLHQSVWNGGRNEFNLISSVISTAELKAGSSFPQIGILLKKLYKLILNPTL